MSNSAIPPNDSEMSLIHHLLELRNILTKSIFAIIVVFIVLFPFANDLYIYISEPLSRFLPEGTSMIATGVASPFLTPFKLSFVLALYISMPFLLYQLWSFIAPALYTHEKQLVGPILFSSSFLFYAGGAFAFYIVFPLVFGFLSSSAPDGVTIATDIALYLDFVIKMFFAFGFAFEVPIVVVILILTGMVSAKKLAHARPYVVVGAFVIGMLLTPPDIISQTLLAIPMWFLYEVGIIVGSFVKKRRDIAKKKRDSEEEGLDEDPEKSNSKKEPKEGVEQESATKNTEKPHPQGLTEEELDTRYAMQNGGDEDEDYDELFDKIDFEFKELDRVHDKRKKAKKKDKKQKKKDKKKDKKKAKKNDK